jgi:hypothetical protein
MDTENFVKPVFKKAAINDFYRDLHKEVQANVLNNKKYQQ